MKVNGIVLLENDKGTRRMHTIAVMTGSCLIYVIHPLSQPDIIEEPILSLEYVSTC